MAGYVFNLDKNCKPEDFFSPGVYATRINDPKKSFWNNHIEATFGDYVSMKEGDQVFFFQNRKIYGIGELVNIGNDCRYFNYPKAYIPKIHRYDLIKSNLLYDNGVNSNLLRCICFYKPSPYFFIDGIDMDSALTSNPSAFRSLRAFWKRSFIKLDDEETIALRNVILKHNQRVLEKPVPGENTYHFSPCHSEAKRKVSIGEYSMDFGISSILNQCANGEAFRHEMALELALLNQISNNNPHTRSILGTWDFISHQVIASPFKPIDYMDRMDLFGYSYIPGFKPAISRYLVGELKKDKARIDDVEQVMKYVDWVNNEYCHGDYSMIKAVLVARDYSPEVLKHKERSAVRRYVTGVRPARSSEWSCLDLIRYRYDGSSHKVKLEVVHAC